jgi:hypothetical protein
MISRALQEFPLLFPMRSLNISGVVVLNARLLFEIP